MNLAWPALGWGLLLLAALVGWGRLTVRLLLPTTTPSWGLDGGWGVAVTVILGGGANLLHLFSPAAMIAYVLLGCALWAGFLIADRQRAWTGVLAAGRLLRRDRVILVLLLLIVAIVTVRYLAAPVRRTYLAATDFSGLPFNMHDDFQSYLVMPEKMLQLGHLAPDPFNDRQLEATYGGMHVLTVLARAALPIERLHILEEGVGIILLCGAVAGVLRVLGVSLRLRLLLILVAQCSLVPNLNLSSHLTAAAVFAALLSLLLDDEPRRFLSLRWSVGLGLLLAGAAALKSTLVPLAFALAGITLLWRLVRQPDRRAWLAAVVAAGVVLLALAPWVALKLETYGTPYFPLLGHGHHWTTTYTPPDDATRTPWQIFLVNNSRTLRLAVVAVVVAGLCLAFPALRRRISSREQAVIAGIACTWLLGLLAMGLFGGGFNVARYLTPLVVIAGPVLLAIGWKMMATEALQRSRRIAGIAIWCALLAGWLWHYHRTTYVYLGMAVLDDLPAGLERYPVATPEWHERLHRVQASVPEGENIFARVSHPFLFDFRRNRVFVADWPGAVSPPPGLPVFKSAETLAKYLLEQKIRYVAYSYGNEALFQYPLYFWRTRPDEPHWERQVARMTFDVQENLWRLGFTRRRIYDDGEICVLDLARPTFQIPPLLIKPTPSLERPASAASP